MCADALSGTCVVFLDTQASADQIAAAECTQSEAATPSAPPVAIDAHAPHETTASLETDDCDTAAEARSPADTVSVGTDTMAATSQDRMAVLGLVGPEAQVSCDSRSAVVLYG